MSWGTPVVVQHKDPTCTGGFSAVLEQPWFDGQRPTTVELRCWDCNTRITFTALTPESTDPEAEAPATEHTPFLGTTERGLLDLPASVPAEQVGPVFLHVDRFLSYREPYVWLVADADGNVLGVVQRYVTGRGAIRFMAGLGIGEGTLTDAHATAAAAAKQVAIAAGLAPAPRARVAVPA